MLFENKLTEFCMLYGVTALHAGAGQSVGAVDLPIQRERHSGWPMVQASGVKGAFREWFHRYYAANPDQQCNSASAQAVELTKKVFGREEGGDNNEGHAGAIAVTDARILLFPVRSNIAPFVWVTCPAIISRVKKDLKLISIEDVFPESIPVGKDECLCVYEGLVKEGIILEDLVVKPVNNQECDFSRLSKMLGLLAPSANRILVVSDENFSFLVRTATEVQPQITIDMETGTTVDGSLRYQELLPADSVLYTVIFFGNERRNDGVLSDVIRDCVKKAISTHVQIGGDMTMGRGIMEVTWLSVEKKENLR